MTDNAKPTEAQLDAAMKAFGDTEIVGQNFTRRAMRAALESAMRSSAPQEPAFPSDATKRMAKTLGTDFVPHGQEPVVDDDAIDWPPLLYSVAGQLNDPDLARLVRGAADFIERNLQAKAPETGQ